MGLSGVLIEQRHLDAAAQRGACDLDGLRAGMPVENLSQAQAIWVHENVPEIAKEAEERTGLQLWALSGSGYGYGDGYGDGSGYGESLA